MRCVSYRLVSMPAWRCRVRRFAVLNRRIGSSPLTASTDSSRSDQRPTSPIDTLADSAHGSAPRASVARVKSMDLAHTLQRPPKSPRDASAAKVDDSLRLGPDRLKASQRGPSPVPSHQSHWPQSESDRHASYRESHSAHPRGSFVLGAIFDRWQASNLSCLDRGETTRGARSA
jgi:hypothetical protein